MKIDHDQWSLLGEKNLGGPDGLNIGFTRLADQVLLLYEGPFILMKCILNDYWADASPQKDGWDHEKIDVVMSKLYYCWVAMLQAQVGEEE